MAILSKMLQKSWGVFITTFLCRNFEISISRFSSASNTIPVSKRFHFQRDFFSRNFSKIFFSRYFLWRDFFQRDFLRRDFLPRIFLWRDFTYCGDILVKIFLAKKSLKTIFGHFFTSRPRCYLEDNDGLRKFSGGGRKSWWRTTYYYKAVC